MIKVAINGFGRIGRTVCRLILDEHSEIEIIALNDLTDTNTLAHLLKYDSVYGIYKKEVSCNERELFIDSSGEQKRIKVFRNSEPLTLPWKDLNIDVVLECSGAFTDFDGANKHLQVGAKKVLISAPSKSDNIPVYLLGVNQGDYNPKKDHIVSMGSCTTNCLAPIAKILDKEFEIISGFMTTVHSYTNDQRILDLSHNDLRRTRAAALNIIPTTTGAAKTVEKCLPSLNGKLDGLALRVPTPVVSIVDFVCLVKKQTTAEQVNEVLEDASREREFKGILAVEKAPLVSSDFKGNSYSAVIDLLSTQVLGSLVKVLCWYDNEWGYACRLAEMIEYLGRKI